MITKTNEPIYKTRFGYNIKHNGMDYGVGDNNPREQYTIDMVESYLAEHPEALIDEPNPPEPTPEEIAAREAWEDEAREHELDLQWIRAQRKKEKK
jgi:hypothetical protein